MANPEDRLEAVNKRAFYALGGLGIELFTLHGAPDPLHNSKCRVCEALRGGLEAQGLLTDLLDDKLERLPEPQKP